MNFLDALMGRLGNGRQAAILAIGVIATALVYGVSTWATRPTMVPLYADIPVENVKTMTDKLTESGIAFELDAAGTTIVMVTHDAQAAKTARRLVHLEKGELIVEPRVT